MTAPDVAQMLADARHIWDTADQHPRPTPTTGQEWGEHWAEMRKEERALPHADPREDDRAADIYYENRRGA